MMKNMVKTVIPSRKFMVVARELLAIFICFAVIFAPGPAAGVPVSNFTALQTALADHQTSIDISHTAGNIYFDSTLTIDYSNVNINGYYSGEPRSIFNGGENRRLFTVSQSLSGIRLRDIDFTAGRGVNASGGAISLASGVAISFEYSNFSGNIASIGGGAIYSNGSSADRNTLTFSGPHSGKITFSGNESTNVGYSGGAIYAGYSNLSFDGEIVFKNNKTVGQGGAIYSEGSSSSKNTLTFGEKAIFTGNESAGGYGGAIYANFADSIFSGDAIFENNKSTAFGGAILFSADSTSRSTVTFSGKAKFISNESSDASYGGGAIGVIHSDLVFDGTAVFENNKSAGRGAAIYVDVGTVVFNDGLELLTNASIGNYAARGAIYMKGTDEENRSTVNIIQSNVNRVTEFRGNTSNNGHNAVYLEQYANLDFNLVNGNAIIYDAIEGDGTKDSNTVNLGGTGGWLKFIGENASINNVNLFNGGQLDISKIGAKELNLVNVTNSGIIKFGIFPENGNCNSIFAGSITLSTGTSLEILMARGSYAAGNSYTLLSSGAAIAYEEISLVVPDGLNLVGEFQNDNKSYVLRVLQAANVEKMPGDVTNFAELQAALGAGIQDINVIVENIDFTDPIVADGNLTISGLSAENKSNFNGASVGFNEANEGRILFRNINFNFAGGAADLTPNSNVIFENVSFNNSNSIHYSVIFYSTYLGEEEILTFRGKNEFRGNEGPTSGAIFIWNSTNVSFGEETIFENNKSASNGNAGAICFIGDCEDFNNRVELNSESDGDPLYFVTFSGSAIFRGNESKGTEGGGGAIYSDLGGMNFIGEAIFENNSS
ncbi:MAG: hypothetical protein LBP39_03825, partial [Rickettsiales bacterium]|nr:hypothetical protein [Rickettsiales bacterium]